MIKPDKMLDSEKAELFVRITRFVGERLRTMIKVKKGRWKQREIRENFGISESNQTVYAHYDKYNKRISEKSLKKCLDGGIVTTQELIEYCANNAREIDFLKNFGIKK